MKKILLLISLISFPSLGQTFIEDLKLKNFEYHFVCKESNVADANFDTTFVWKATTHNGYMKKNAILFDVDYEQNDDDIKASSLEIKDRVLILNFNRISGTTYLRSVNLINGDFKEYNWDCMKVNTLIL